MPVLALDLGGTKLSSALFSDAGEILVSKSVLLDQRAGKEVGALIIDLTKSILDEAKHLNEKVNAIGICVPGIAYKSGKVWAPNIKGWDDYPLMEELSNAFDSIFIQVESDRACYILGEVWKGNAQGCRDAIYLSVGTGIGAGILVNGEILRGTHDIGGAIGWMAMSRPYDAKYTSCGDFEYHASGSGIANLAREMMKVQPSILHSYGKENITAHHVFDAAEKGDPIARQIIKTAIEYWGMSVANLVSIFNPEKIILGGGVFGPALKYVDDIYSEAKKWAQPVSITKVKIEGSALGGDAGLYGAGYLALKHYSF